MFARAIALTAALATWTPLAVAQSIVDVAVGDGRFSTLVAAVTAAGLVDVLDGDGTFTVFAPTDDAFRNVNVDQLLEDEWRAHLNSVLLYHVLGEVVLSSDLEQDLNATTLEGSPITVTSLSPPQINNAEILIADISADNGIIHAIDDVLLPPSMTQSIVDFAVETAALYTLVDYIFLADLADFLAVGGPFTVFAPTVEAFEQVDEATLAALIADPQGLLTEVLEYHIVNGIVLVEDLEDGTSINTIGGADIQISVGDSVMVNEATVISADGTSVTNVLASNGVLHFINQVLIPPSLAGPAPIPVPPPPVPSVIIDVSSASIVDLAVGSEDFKVLVVALGAAGLVETLQGEGPFTVFAPVNSAFKGVDINKLLDPQWKVHLKGILTYHVLPTLILSEDLTLDASATSLEGSDVTVASLNPVKINDATVVQVDIEATNGVVHAVNEVLLPPFMLTNIVEIAASNPDTFSTLVDLILLAGLDGSLTSGGPFTVFAPTNQAFAKIPQETVDSLKNDPAGALTDILLYHVVSGIVTSGDLTDGAALLTVNGPPLDVSLIPVRINDADVVLSDVLTSNGVIHAVDTVLIPPVTPTLPHSVYKDLQSLDYQGPGNACMEVKGGFATSGQCVILGDCMSSKSGWRVIGTGTGMIKSEIDDNFCLQAGYGGHDNMIGRVVRIEHCHEENQLQKWVCRGSTLRPSLDQSLCVVWSGKTADVGSDPIVLLPCSQTEMKRRWKLG